MRDKMADAIGDTIVVGLRVMEWMQDNARICSSNGRPVTWRTPSGFVVHQEYHTPGYKRINTLLGCTYLVQNKPSEISIRKQAISIAPNMVHSFDAAHMMLTIERAALRDIVDFAVVHDSFGCHAAYMDEFVGLIREEFVKIYRQDWFARLQADFQRSAGHGVPLIAPPERGDFNIDEVLGAEFFFA